MSLKTQSNFHQDGVRYFRAYSAGDDFYESLIAAHEGLSEEQSAVLNSRLVLLLSNHIGELKTLREAMALAKADLPSDSLDQ